LARGTRIFSKASAAVLEARWPILSSVRKTARPGAPFSTTRQLMALRSSATSAHLPKSRIRSATSPLVMKVLPPSTTTCSPSGVKRVFIPVASDPAEGSVMASAPSPPWAMRGKSRCFCASLPASMSGFMAWKVVAQMIPVEAQAAAISRTQPR
jgi:hypothetical protein